MGTWGTSISANDTYADIYADFKDLYNDGMDIPEITEKLIKENREMNNNPDNAHNFWFAIAKSQWEYKQLQPSVLSKVTTIIESGADIESWRELDAAEDDIEERKKVLNKFLASLQSEKAKAKARKKTKIHAPVFEKGDCLTFTLDNGNYGGALVITAEQIDAIGINLIANTTINQSAKPTVEDFKAAGVLILNHNNWIDEPHIKFILAPLSKNQSTTVIEKIGQIEIKRTYLYSSFCSTYGSGGFDFPNQANMQLESEKTKPKSDLKITIKELIQKNIWKFW